MRSPLDELRAENARLRDAIEAALILDLTTNSRAGLSALVRERNPKLAAIIDRKQRKPDTQDKRIQARVDIILLQRELKETRREVLRWCIGKISDDLLDKIMGGKLHKKGDGAVARDLARMIWESPTLRAVHVARLQAKRDDVLADPKFRAIADDK